MNATLNTLSAIVRRLVAALDAADDKTHIAAITVTIVYDSGTGHKPWVIEYLDVAQLRCLLTGEDNRE